MIFLIILEAVRTSTHTLCFRSKVKKKFYYIKVVYKGYTFHGHVFLMAHKCLPKFVNLCISPLHMEKSTLHMKVYFARTVVYFAHVHEKYTPFNPTFISEIVVYKGTHFFLFLILVEVVLT